MKPADIWKLVQSIGPCLIAEYRGSMVEKVRWVDKNDGKARGFVKAEHLFEFGNGAVVQSITLEQMYPDTVQEPQDVVLTFTRGQRYLLRIRGLDTERRTIKGRLDPSFEPVALAEA